MVYRVVEIAPVDEAGLEEALNAWTPLGWTFERVEFVQQPGVRRPTLAWLFFFAADPDTPTPPRRPLPPPAAAVAPAPPRRREVAAAAGGGEDEAIDVGELDPALGEMEIYPIGIEGDPEPEPR